MKETDKGIPNWLVFIFFGAIVFGVVYGSYVHGFASDSTGALVVEGGTGYVVAAPAKIPRSAEAVTAGEKLASSQCASCHGPDLKGALGPNLLDGEWLHGSDSETKLFQIIVSGITTGMKFGSKTTTMPARGGLQSDREVWQVVYYLSGKNTSIKKDAN